MLVDNIGIPLVVGDFIIKTAAYRLHWARIIKITPPHKVRVSFVRGVQVPALDARRSTLWAYNSNPSKAGEMRLCNALKVLPEGVPKEVMDLLDREKLCL